MLLKLLVFVFKSVILSGHQLILVLKSEEHGVLDLRISDFLIKFADFLLEIIDPARQLFLNSEEICLLIAGELYMLFDSLAQGNILKLEMLTLIRQIPNSCDFIFELLL